jgi:3-hydroxy-9,10-secoandrosta-1,3,5(10)-triene-9,17-dione monooxygenase reductase component
MQKQAFDSKEFRRALGTFTTGVTVITARGTDGVPVGVTANSFSSVSLDPPLVLWSLARSARSLPVFQGAEYFAIHILAAGQEDLSNRFASRGEDKFADLDLEHGLGDTPLLAGCSTRMQCRTTHQYEGGDHIIFVGEVIDLVNNGVPPLVFQAGKYALAARKADEMPLLPSGSTEFREDFLGYLLWRAYFQFHTEMRKQATISGFSDHEFLLLNTLLHSNWRSAESLYKAMFHDGARDDAVRALSSLVDRGLVEKKTKDGKEWYGANEAGKEKALSLLAEAKMTELAFMQQLGDWQSVSFKNLLKGFIVETNPGLPHPWENVDNDTEGAQLKS